MTNIKFGVKNIEGMANTEIDINGLTVITGGTDTGKSRLCKLLSTFVYVYSSYAERFERFKQEHSYDEIAWKEILSADIWNEYANRVFNSVFEGEVGVMESSPVELSFTEYYADGDKDKRAITINKDVQIDKPEQMARKIFYIDNSNIFDFISSTNIMNSLNVIQREVLTQLNNKAFDTSESNVMSMSWTMAGKKDKVAKFYKIANKLCKGNLVVRNFEYLYEENSKYYKIKNISTCKKFVLLLMGLIYYCVLNEGDILVLDNIDYCFDEKSKGVFAELLKSLNADLGIKVVIVTHSTELQSLLKDVADTKVMHKYKKPAKKSKVESDEQLGKMSLSNFN